MIDLWYKDAVIYEVDVKTYQDGNGDGIGDFPGLTRRLAHIQGLGVTCIWLQPFYPSPGRDDGYDVSDYYSVDPRLGTLGDFVEFTRQASERGIRVLADLVVHHTSNEHPWFRQARADRTSLYRDYFVWSDKEPEDAAVGVVFPGVQKAVWSYDEEAGAYYHHQFYDHQPDLNLANPAVREEICRIMGFWLELGISGFRLDAAGFLLARSAKEDAGAEEAYAYLREFRKFLSWRRSGAIMLAEANVPPEDIPHFFGPGTEIHMLFSFLVNQYLFLALAREKAAPLVKILKKMGPLPGTGQWANFLRNHDELDLGRLSPKERGEVYAAFAPDQDMRIYERGIRRRLAPMLDGDRARQQLAYSLMFSLPGTPVLRYGDEIGMGDDLSLPERLSVRTPMQWSDKPDAGFSTAPANRFIRPIVSGAYGPKRLNVAGQQRDAASFLNWMERLVRVRKECPEIGWGELTLLDSGHAAVLAHCCEWKDGAIVALHNLGAKPARVRLDLNEKEGEHLVVLLGEDGEEEIENARKIELPAYGCRWFRLCGGRWKTP